MAKRRAEDWVKPRGKAQHFTKEELEKIKNCFLAGKTAYETAREMLSSTVTIRRHFCQFMKEGLQKGGALGRPKHSPANYTARLYKPNWEIS